MKKQIYCLRKIGTDEIAVVQAGSKREAVLIAWVKDKEHDWEHVAECSVKSFLKQETVYREVWRRLALKAWGMEKI